VKAFIDAFEKPGIKNEAFNIGTGVPTSINGLAEMVIKFSGSGSTIAHDKAASEGVSHYIANISKARRVLGWEPVVRLEQGLREFTLSS
jgi:nucleoside-diphosphate-sugar epimerase